MPTSKKYSKFYRIRKAYSTAFRVIFSYAWLKLKSKIRGKKYYQKRLIPLHFKNAERVKNAILDLEGLFIKIGQLLSVLSNYLPSQFQEPLEGLQDKIPARPYSEIRARIIKELGDAPEKLFVKFSESPIAAASIAQAHRATTKEGKEVVVKVQHANIEEMSQVDLEIIKKLVHLVGWMFEIKGLDYTYIQIRKMIEEELDFRKEAVSMQAIKTNLKEEAKFIIPEPQLEFSTGRVLTTTFCEGVKIGDVQQMTEWNIDRRDLSNRLIHAYCQMVFVDGFYHADPHPGNILVQQDGTIVLLDFGATDTLPAEMRKGFLVALDAAIKNDTEKTIEALQNLGFIAEGKEAEVMAKKIIIALRSFVENELEFDGLSLKDFNTNPFDSSIFDLIKDIGFKGMASTIQVPKEWVLLNRMVTLLVGICNTLDPHANPLDVVRPYFKEFLVGEKGDLIQFLKKLLTENLTAALALPGDIQRLIAQTRRGEIEMRVPEIQQQSQLFYKLGQQLIFAILAIAAAGFGWLFWKEGAVLEMRVGFGLAGFFVIWLMRISGRK